MKYEKFKPLPYNGIPSTALTNDPYFGMGIVVYTNGTEQHVYNMIGERLALLSNYKGIDFLKLSYTGNWFAYAGVFINKKRYRNVILNDSPKFIILDVLVFDGDNLSSVQPSTRISIHLYKIPKSLTYGKAEIYNHLFSTKWNGIFTTP